MNTLVKIAGEGFFLLRERDIQKEFSLTDEDVHFLTQQHAHLTDACRFFDTCKLFIEQSDPGSEYTQSYYICGSYHEKIDRENFNRRRTRAQKLFLNKVSAYFIDAYGLPLRTRDLISPHGPLKKSCSIVRIDEALDMLSRRCEGAKDFDAYAKKKHLADFRERFKRRSDYWDPAEPKLLNGRRLTIRHLGAPRNMAHILTMFEQGSPRISTELAAALPFEYHTTKGEPGTWQDLPFKKVSRFRYFKNGRADLEFADNVQRMEFYVMFCGGK